MKWILSFVVFSIVIIVAAVWATSPVPTPALMIRCRRPGQVPGPDGRTCRASIPRFMWDDDKKQCVLFTYNGCGETDNNFETKEACTSTCGGIMTRAPPCPPSRPLDMMPAGCDNKKILAPPNGCPVYHIHCPNANATGQMHCPLPDEPCDQCCPVVLMNPNACKIVPDCTSGPQKTSNVTST